MENLYKNFTDEQTNEANDFFGLLCMGSMDVHVAKWVKSGNKITYDQLKKLKNCTDTFTMSTLLDSYSKGNRIKVTYFKVVYKKCDQS